jgi:hypothetical protein
MDSVQQWHVFEITFRGLLEYRNPSQDVTVTVTFRGPNDEHEEVDAFWDGGDTWRARFSTGALGTWRWRSVCFNADDYGFHLKAGSFECVPYVGDNPVYLHGPLRLAADRRSFVHSDGTPFFWLGDTVWSGVQKASPDDWRRFLSVRREQGFTLIQHGLSHWRAFPVDGQGEQSYREAEPGQTGISINAAWFQRLDAKFTAINEAGLVAAPIIMWAIRGEHNPGYVLPEPDAIHLSRYIVARYGAYNVAWSLGGDGDYRGDLAERWRRIGTAVFRGRHDRPVTMHPGGQHWVADEFRDQEWFDFIGYQSGHGRKPVDWRWLVQGPPAQEWLKPPARPIVNLEPNYEAHIAYDTQHRFDSRDVRRALYWSLLVDPTAGVTYGDHGIWPFPAQRELPADHAYTGESGPWYEAMNDEGARQLRHLRSLFDSLAWWQLHPAQDLLAEQPGEVDVSRFITVAKSDDGKALLAYLPEGGSIRLLPGTMPGATATWYDPRTGAQQAATGNGNAFSAPDEQDWLLVLRA